MVQGGAPNRVTTNHKTIENCTNIEMMQLPIGQEFTMKHLKDKDNHDLDLAKDPSND